MATGSFYRAFPQKIGIVCDAVLYDSLKSAAQFVYISTADDWRERIASLDAMLVTSTWRGLHDDEWYGLGRTGDPIRAKLLKIIDGCRAAGVPTVFYSKEDPSNYKVFLDFAKRCDVVFTSAAEMVSEYRRDCGHDRIGVLPFCIDPATMNPIGCTPFPHEKGAIFSGSWMLKYPFRCRDLAALLDGAVATGRGLDIIDRNSFRSRNRGYRFPARFQRLLHPSVPHDRLAALHKEYDWSVNVNSVTESGTMFAGRCYELLACGCPVVSNFSYGMLRHLPEVAIADSARFVRNLMQSSTPRELRIRRAAGVRRVMTGETCYDRLAKILAAVGLSADLPRRTAAVVIPQEDAALRECFNRQAYPDRRLVVTLSPEEADLAGCDYVSYWQIGQDYSPYFLQDLIDVFKYTDADFAVWGEGDYCKAEKPVSGRTVFRRERMGESDVKGFSVPAADESPAEIGALCAAGHEITEPVARSLDDLRPSVWVRALACLSDNGLWYTVRRIFLGRQY